MDFRRSRKMSLDAQYAKWDSLEVEDDDDDEPRRPRVTKLEGPSRLTIGDGSCSATALPEPQDLSAVRHNYLGAAAAATKPAAARTPAAATKAAPLYLCKASNKARLRTAAALRVSNRDRSTAVRKTHSNAS